MPAPTNAAGSAVASGKLWSFGGEGPSSPTGATVAYDPATNSWTSASTLTVARSGVAGTAIGTTLLAAGGNTGSASCNGRGLGCGSRFLRDAYHHVQSGLRRRHTASAAGRLDGDERARARAAVDDFELGHAHAALRFGSERGLHRQPPGRERQAPRLSEHPDPDELGAARLPEQLLHSDHVRRRGAGDQHQRRGLPGHPYRRRSPHRRPLQRDAPAIPRQPARGSPGLDRQLAKRLHHDGRDPAPIRRWTERRPALAPGHGHRHRGSRLAH